MISLSPKFLSILRFCSLIYKNPYSKAMEINSRTFKKMGYVLTDNNDWVLKNQVGAHVEEEHDEVKE